MKSDSLPWIRKYLPVKLDQVIGQTIAILQIKDFIKNNKGKKALFLYGPTGTGKTSCVQALCNENDFELVEINASDSRNKKSIEELLGAVVNQTSLFSKGKLILIDELDGISGRKDRGAVNAIKDIVSKSSFPIIFTANDAYSNKLKNLRKISALIEFAKLDTKDIMEQLKFICAKEKIKYADEELIMLARSCNGDLRAAINDLQTFSHNGKFDPESADFLVEREQKQNISEALFKVFKTFKPEISLKCFDNVDINIDEIISWVEYNTPREYTKIKDLAKAFDEISLADVYKGRIRRWQYWRLLVYIYQLLSVGISLAKEEKYSKTIEYKPTTKGLNIWQYNMKNAKKKSIAQKLSEKSHLSKKQAYKYVDTLKFIMQNPKMKDDLVRDLELDDGEIQWLER